ncbi:MAG: SH3 domain-containing protein, partial [Leptolyngbyaceae cyanobacterium SL_7_1]|nr:SH3 domain-containing protein [Leptolyngbyaceae cyanobacterium SL_7_1]
MMKPSFVLGALASATISLVSALPALSLPASLTASSPDSYINIRTSPSTQARITAYGLVGDRVETLRSTRGQDGYTWHYIRFNNTRQAEGWVRGDLLRIDSATSSPTPSS